MTDEEYTWIMESAKFLKCDTTVITWNDASIKKNMLTCLQQTGTALEVSPKDMASVLYSIATYQHKPEGFQGAIIKGLQQDIARKQAEIDHLNERLALRERAQKLGFWGRLQLFFTA